MKGERDVVSDVRDVVSEGREVYDVIDVMMGRRDNVSDGRDGRDVVRTAREEIQKRKMEREAGM